ncbi:MAG: DUF6049 family protein [Actinomycetes bacterium]
MRKFFSLVLVAFFIAAPSPVAHAESQTVRLVSVPHQEFSGLFRNDELAQALTPSGVLGQLVFVPLTSQKIWVIDPALVDEVVTMSTSYTLVDTVEPAGSIIAAQWLRQLRRVTARNDVVALAYGNPDVGLAKSLAPTELRTYYDYGKTQLEVALNRTVRSEPNGGWSTGKVSLNNAQINNYSANRKALTNLMKEVSDPTLVAMRAKLAQLLSPTLDKTSAKHFANSAAISVANQLHRLRITSGKYQITTESAKLPVTLINDFPVAVHVKVSMLPMNSRVIVDNVSEIDVPAQSKAQLGVQLTVVAPGQTTIVAQIESADGVPLVEPSLLQINSTVIDKRVTWFTTGAAILLLLAAVTQSVRRVRRGRNNEI